MAPRQLDLKNKRKNKLLFLALFSGIILVILVLIFFQNPVQLPDPLIQCPVQSEWSRIRPGVTTFLDVIRILGKPSGIDIDKRGTHLELYFEYEVKGGLVSQFVKNKIFFRTDGVVDWIEAVVADLDGKYHPISEEIENIGLNPEFGYMNDNYDPTIQQFDILAGPDQIDVWTECGIAIDILPACQVLESDENSCSPLEKNNKSDYFTFRSSSPYSVGSAPSQNLNDAILMKFFFKPTTSQGFMNYYRYKIPYGIWDNYVKKIIK